MFPYKSCHKCCSFKVFVTNISLLKYYHKHFPFEVLSQMLYQRLVGLLQMLQQRLVGLSQTSQQRLFTIVAAKAFHNCCSKRLFTNVAAKGFSQMLQQTFVTNAAVMFHDKSNFLRADGWFSVLVSHQEIHHQMSFGLLWEIFPPLSVQFNIHTHLSTIQGRYPTARVLAKSGAANSE